MKGACVTAYSDPWTVVLNKKPCKSNPTAINLVWINLKLKKSDIICSPPKKTARSDHGKAYRRVSQLYAADDSCEWADFIQWSYYSAAVDVLLYTHGITTTNRRMLRPPTARAEFPCPVDDSMIFPSRVVVRPAPWTVPVRPNTVSLDALTRALLWTRRAAGRIRRSIIRE